MNKMNTQEKTKLAINIMRNRMTDEQFRDYSQSFIDTEELAGRIEDYFRNEAGEEELDKFISEYN
jgi:arsenate reductase-like glutaredoxin family protein